MKVSIIIASYNKESFLTETLISVTNQSYKNIEVVLIDDGSTDSSKIICENFANRDPRIRYISQKNQGVIKTRNYGFQISTGEIILPFDADDIMPNDFIEKIIVSAKNNPDVTVFSTRVWQLDGSEINLPDINLPVILFTNSISNSSAFRKSALEVVKGYNENMTMGYEDWDFWIYFLENNFKALRVKDTFYYYRILENSRNKTANKLKSKLQKQIYLNHINTYEKWRPHFILIKLYPLTKLLRAFGLKKETIRAIKFFRKIDN